MTVVGGHSVVPLLSLVLLQRVHLRCQCGQLLVVLVALVLELLPLFEDPSPELPDLVFETRDSTRRRVLRDDPSSR